MIQPETKGKRLFRAPTGASDQVGMTPRTVVAERLLRGAMRGAGKARRDGAKLRFDGHRRATMVAERSGGAARSIEPGRCLVMNR